MADGVSRDEAFAFAFGREAMIAKLLRHLSLCFSLHRPLHGHGELVAHTGPSAAPTTWPCPRSGSVCMRPWRCELT